MYFKVAGNDFHIKTYNRIVYIKLAPAWVTMSNNIHCGNIKYHVKTVFCVSGAHKTSCKHKIQFSCYFFVFLCWTLLDAVTHAGAGFMCAILYDCVPVCKVLLSVYNLFIMLYVLLPQA